MRETPIPKRKISIVKELSDLLKRKKTVLIASIMNIPASQFQEIGKKLRGKAVVKVPKKNLIFRAIDSSGEEAIRDLKKHLKENVAILFSDLDAFELAGELLKNTSPSKAKAGQIAPFDIEVEAGPTDLVPGPAITELGALGIQIQIEKGKISIKDAKVIAKEGQKISAGAADVMVKLDIKPFKVGFVPVCAFDTQEKKLYVDIKIDTEKTIGELKEAYARALPFAVEIGYVSEDTITFMIGKAGSHEKRLIKVITGEPAPLGVPQSNALGGNEVVEGINGEGKEESKEIKQEEPKVDTTAGLAGLFG